MQDAVISWSLRHRLAVIGVWLGIAVSGVASFARLPLDAFPDTSPVQVQVNTVASALGPLEIERHLTAPIEQSISGLRGLMEVRSVSKAGFSQVTVLFDDDVDTYLARQLVLERVQQVELPGGSTSPPLVPWRRAWARSFTTWCAAKATASPNSAPCSDGASSPSFARFPASPTSTPGVATNAKSTS